MNDSPEVHIRPATKKDIPSVVVLWRDMIEAHGDKDNRFELSDDAEDIFQMILSNSLMNDDHRLLVADCEEEVVGYTLASINDNVPIFKVDRYGFIADLTVRKEHRRSGIGRRLFEAAKTWFQENGVQAIQLNVSEFNPGGLQFWKECGFRDFIKTLWYDLPGTTE